MTPDEIRAARESLGLTQTEAARLLGYAAQERVSEIERGKVTPHGAVVLLLRAYLDGYRPHEWPRKD